MQIRAAVVREKDGRFNIEDIELDEPREDEVIVKIVSAGVCHTDLLPRAQIVPSPFPAVYGHEGAGIVEKVGSGVTKLKPGDHVVMGPDSCGICPNCLNGHPMFCRDHFGCNLTLQRQDGSPTMRKGNEVIHGNMFAQSSFANYALGRERNVVKIPDDVPLEIMGPLGCGVQTGALAVIKTLHPYAGDSIAIYGSGSVGLSALLAAVATGCTTRIMVDPNEQRLEFALELGATHIINPNMLDPVKEIQAITGGSGTNYALETSGNLKALRQASDSIPVLGELGMIGAPPVGSEAAFDSWGLLLGKKIRGIVQGDSIPDIDIPRLIALYKQGRFPFDKLITTYPFEDINEAVADHEKGTTIKPVLLQG